MYNKNLFLKILLWQYFPYAYIDQLRLAPKIDLHLKSDSKAASSRGDGRSLSWTSIKSLTDAT